MQHADTTHCGHRRGKGSVLERVVSSNRTEPLSNKLSEAIGLKCTSFYTTLVGYMSGVEWLRVA